MSISRFFNRTVSSSLLLSASFGSLLSGCAWQEGLDITNLKGTIFIGPEAATREMGTADGGREQITDPRLIGPIYLGLYTGVSEGFVAYPHPDLGPVFESGQSGDAYPYGGTSLGDFRFACFNFLTCKVPTGRFVDFDDLLHWFNVRVGDQVTDGAGRPIEVGEQIRQTCMDFLNVTTDHEIGLTPDDKNGDGVIDAEDLDFVWNDAMNAYEAEFTIWQQELFKADDGTGMSLWGWMDTPSESSFGFGTCDPTAGRQVVDYESNFTAGRPEIELLNRPYRFIGDRDWVVSQPHVYENSDDIVEIWIDQEVRN